MTDDHARIRVKAMLIAPDATGRAHAVSVHPPTFENPHGYHRFVGGSVEPGETHRDAVVREVREELGATVHDLTYLDVVESIYSLDGRLGHEVVFVYTGRLDPQPDAEGAHLVETDGSVLPVVWRSVDATQHDLPLYPAAAAALVGRALP